MDDTIDEIVGASDDEGQVLTAAEVLSKIEELWVTELLSPTLECHQSELVDCLLDQMAQMDANLKRCKKTDFRLAIHKMELERVRYVLCSYLRCRLQKVERFTHHLLQKQGTLSDPGLALLSPQELTFAKEFALSLESHFSTLALQHITHDKLREFDPSKMSVKPNIDAYVFLKVKKDSHAVLIEDNTGEGRDEEVDLDAGGQHLMTYRSVQQLLQAGDVALI